MLAKETKALMRRLIEEFNKGKATAIAAIDELYAADIIFHSSHDEDIRGLKNFKEYNSEFFSAVPDAHFTIDDIIAEGNKVAARWTMTGTQTGELRGAPATNKKVTLRATNHRPHCRRQVRGRVGKV
jgi:steroid delta-isomerase-like uncharacterized protein